MPSSKALISIIIPVYGAEKYLARCLDSIQKQTYQNIEVLLIDDDSKDGSADIAKLYAKNDSRFKYFHKENGGQSSARNYGISLARGNYLAFSDDDDTMQPNMIERLLELITKHDGDMAICSRNDKNNDWNDKGICVFESGAVNVENMACVYDFNVPWNKLYRRELIINERFPLVKFCEDLYLMVKLYSKCNRVVYTSERLYNYDLRENNTTFHIRHDDNYYLTGYDVDERILDYEISKGIYSPFHLNCFYEAIKESYLNGSSLLRTDIKNRYSKLYNKKNFRDYFNLKKVFLYPYIVVVKGNLSRLSSKVFRMIMK